MRIEDHPILGKLQGQKKVTIIVDGKPMEAFEGEPIATALMAVGRRVLRYTTKRKDPRGVFCCLGRCTDCVMTVDGKPNVRTCVTPAVEGTRVETQSGLGSYGHAHSPRSDEG
jgi:aerobic-type carbon monoxide dehydrogenase small subunit (CoxS/CutS family)